ncbi:monocarboxylate transporter 12-like [Acanthaster planci]|uniref:Monocarboxylate transporter 12-like n=1 Tax=Acanthaster planci TaxID=133434 RepID=A0A8B7ZHJ2_ACAPL|nr:monocarboxylate transporter 12-like [Acanthaster planci]
MDVGSQVGSDGHSERQPCLARPCRWGRIVVSASFFAFFLEMGSLQTHGVYMPALLKEFEVGSSELGWVASSALAVLCLSGDKHNEYYMTCVEDKIMESESPGRHARRNHDGYRNRFGSPGDYHHPPPRCLGLIVGLGGALVHVGLVYVVGQYYSKHHSLANGIAFSGIGAGIFVFSPLIQHLIDTFGWRGSFIIESAIVANLVVMGALFRPVSRYKTRHFQDAEAVMESGFESDEHAGSENCNGDSREFTGGGLKKRRSLGDRAWLRRCRRYGLCTLLSDSPSLLLLYLACFLLEVGCSAIIFHITNYGRETGFDAQQASQLLSYFGIGGVVGRASHGLLLKIRRITPYRMFVAALLFSALFVSLIIVPKSYGGKVFLVISFGTTSSVLFPLVAVIIRQFVGIANLPLAFGLSIFCNGAGTALGGYLIGVIRDALGNYIAAFYLIGVFFIISAAVLLLPPLLTCCRRRARNSGTRDVE